MKLIQGNRRELERKVIRLHMREATRQELDAAKASLLPKGKLKVVQRSKRRTSTKNLPAT